ncbi:MAG: cysteine--tRNA ligase [Candidatus Liptonbacteria bacterium]|nr:cysteine--tRNA ligase [Candidatus Liptonbacteria bacterium]
MKIYLFNTLSGKKELLVKPKGRPLRLFVCGPTVYDDPHIGNGRTYVFFDTLVKYLRSTGLKVFYLQNITDIDDKIIARAHAEKVSFSKIAETYLAVYFRDMKALGVTAVTKYARATKYIPQIQKQIEVLLKKGYAYEIAKDGIYYDVSKFRDYGKLSRRTTVQAESGVSRIDESIHKKNKADFALWKFGHTKAPMQIINGEPAWPSPWGLGRPGWHIEDTAITEYFFGPQYDIHGGAVDLKFPHHEAEIAQQEAASGKKPLVKIWMHGGFLTLEDQKMSKSLGNFMTIDQFLKNTSPEVFRLMTLSHHYRSPLNYTVKLNKEMKLKWLAILEFLAKAEVGAKSSLVKKSRVSNLAKFEKEFTLALADDFNTPAALGILFKFIGELQPKLWQLSRVEAKQILKKIRKTLKTLGFSFKFPQIPLKIKGLARERENLRKNQQFVQSDSLRKKANDLGFLIEDSPLGPFVWPKS